MKNWYNMIHQSVWCYLATTTTTMMNPNFFLMNPFSMISFSKGLLSEANCIGSPYLFFITESFSWDTSGKTTSWITSICLTVVEKSLRALASLCQGHHYQNAYFLIRHCPLATVLIIISLLSYHISSFK